MKSENKEKPVDKLLIALDKSKYSFNFIKKAQEQDPEFQKKLEEQRIQETLERIEADGLM